MDPRLLHYYNRELQHLREMGGEFAKEYPKIAARLGLDGFECADPYVERLLEGFSFLAARVQLKIDAEFPRFTQHLFENVYPHYLAPTPSMVIAQFQPDPTEGELSEGFVIPRDSRIKSTLARGEKTACEYRTAHPVTLWPLEIVEAAYLTQTRDLVRQVGDPTLAGARGGIRIRLRAAPGLTMDKIALDKLVVYLRGRDELPMMIYEQMLGHSVGMIASPAGNAPPWRQSISRTNIRRCGFSDAEALLPYTRRSFQGYRLLQEYFSFPQRFLFVELGGLAEAVHRCTGNELDLTILFDRVNSDLESSLESENLALFCAPAVNLFEKRADRINMRKHATEFHVVADRTRPMDFEVHTITSVTGFGRSAREEQQFLPFYQCKDWTTTQDKMAYYSVRREPRMISSERRKLGPRTRKYIGSESFVSLVDALEAPYRSDLRQLAVTCLCTNRDLPHHMAIGRGPTDFTLDSGAPVEAIRCVAGPTPPKPAPAGKGEVAWRLVSHLSLNYLSLLDNDEESGAAALRDLLMLYGDMSEAAIRKQIEGVQSIERAPIHRRIPTDGPITFGRGIEVTVRFDEAAFEGSGVFLLGAVLEQFFARYVSINSFTETVVRTLDRGEVMRWPARLGRRPTI